MEEKHHDRTLSGLVPASDDCRDSVLVDGHCRHGAQRMLAEGLHCWDLSVLFCGNNENTELLKTLCKLHILVSYL